MEEEKRRREEEKAKRQMMMAGSFAGVSDKLEGAGKNFVIQKGEQGDKLANLSGTQPKPRGVSKEQQEEAKVCVGRAN